MPSDPSHTRLHIIGRAISIAVMIGTVVIALLVVHEVNANPRTDDAEVFANYIGMAPLVNGPVTHLYVSDNQLVKAGDPLFDIDERPYAYALARARSDQQALQGQIGDERRIIAGKSSGVDVAKASVLSCRSQPCPRRRRRRRSQGRCCQRQGRRRALQCGTQVRLGQSAPD